MIPPPPRQKRGAREGGRSRARPHAPAACSRRNHEGQANPRQHAREPHGPRPGTASEHEPERYRGHALHGQCEAKDTRFVACPGKAEEWTEARRPPAQLAPVPAQSGGTAHRPPPPPGAGAPQKHRPTPRRAHSPEPGRGETGPGCPPPPKRNKPHGAQNRGRTRGGAQTAWNGPTSAQHRDRARCARHTNQGRGAGAPRERERTHTHRTCTRGIPEGQPDRARGTHRPRGMVYQRARVRDTRTGRPATDSAGHAGREGETGKTRHQVPARAPRTGRERRTRTTRVLHPPRQ